VTKSKRIGKPLDVVLPAGLVPHPRFGNMPIDAGSRVAEPEIRRSFWRLRSAQTMYPETAIVADISAQVDALYPRRYYVDLLKTCQACHRPFIFFAREQKYWFETLGFNVAADATRCTTCRRSMHATKAMLDRWAASMKAAHLDDKQLLGAVDDATELAEAGVLVNVARLGALKNRALRQCGGNDRIARLQRVLERIRAGAKAG
jgi:hypothetical protein